MTRTPPLLAITAALLFGCSLLRADEPVLTITGPELERVDPTRDDGNLPRYPGSETFTVLRADPDHPDQSDGAGWTYHHHPDIAAWKGRLYVGWNSCPKDEDEGTSRELISTSADGKSWSRPIEMFPRDISTPLRMYFFHAPNGRMLVIAGLRVNRERLEERNKGPMVVREILADHSLGPVFTLRQAEKSVPNQPPPYQTSADAAFVQACRQLLGEKLYLEQSDYGRLLDPPDRMKWHDPASWTGHPLLERDGEYFGKAMCFFTRADGAVVAVMKRRWVTLSSDGGKTWAVPTKPPTLVTGMGKVWGQRTPSGKYILVYNPDRQIRRPLAAVTSDDGITFKDMRVIHGELPKRRYEGLHKSEGLSYVRGLNQWSDDGSRAADKAVWLVFSVNKEDIWVARLPQ
jgi:hypothetical protein